MKASLLIYVGLFATTLLSCQQKDRAPDKVKIKSITALRQLNSHLDDYDKIADTLLLVFYQEYDSSGHLTYEKVTDWDVLEHNFYQNKYNQNGKLVSRWCSYGRDSKLQLCDTFLYDTKRQLIKKIEFGKFAEDTTDIVTYKYNDKGQLIMEESTGDYYSNQYIYEGDKLVEKTDGIYRLIYSYNANGQLLKEAEFYKHSWSVMNHSDSLRSANDTVAVALYKYNSKGKLITQNYENRETSFRELIRYDNHGNIIERINKTSHLLYRYDFY